jgi:glycosyltransferase involved in cell wall biosynthesis
VEAARYLKSGMKIVIAGRGSESETDHLVNLIREHNLSNRVTLAGYISEEQKRDYYARCRAVFFGGYEEDYGYVPLEAFYAAKPVIALDDTGGALEFVEDKVNGFIAANQASAVAGRIDLLGEDANLAEKLGRAGARTLEEKRVNWDHVISSLLGAADA